MSVGLYSGLPIPISKMLSIVAAKFILKGAVKKLIFDPAISATISMIPKSSLVNYSLLGKDISVSTTDLIKFGIDKLYSRYGEKKLTYNLDKVDNHIYKIIPANDLAAIFFKEYTGSDELLVDLSTVDKYLDILYKEDVEELQNLEQEIFDNDDAIIQIIHDLDLAVSRSKPNNLDTPNKEQELIDEVLKKNMDLVKKSENRLKRQIKGPQSAVDEILDDFPETPFEPKSDKEKIDEILERISKEEKSQIKRMRDKGQKI